MESKKKKGILGGVAAAVLSVFGVQNATGQETAEAQSARGTPIFEEIIVTAQKREESLRDVPISASVLSGRYLDRFTGDGVNEALTLVPGVKMTQSDQGGGTQLSLRGVAAAGPLFTGSSTVGYYVDSVPFGLVKSSIVPEPNPYDLERIEVLRGPQGTLYGASAINGVVRIITRDADLEDFEVKTRTSLSNTEDGSEGYRADVAINVPLIEGKLAARAVLGYATLGGWIDYPDQGKEDDNEGRVNNVRLKVNAQPTEALSLGLTAWRSRTRYDNPPTSDDDRQFAGVLGAPIWNDYDTLGFTLSYQFPAFSLTSMSSYIDYTNRGFRDNSLYGTTVGDFTGLDSKVFAQEVILNSTSSDAWRWSLGGFYRDATDRLVQVGPFFTSIDFDELSESFAVYGELTRLVGGQLEITAGLRYFEDEVTQAENVSTFGGPLQNDSTTFSTTSPRLVLTWHQSDRSTLYGSYSEGFRSGFNQNALIVAALPSLPPVKEDTLKNYEVGAKGSLFDDRVAYDAAVYYIDWQDVQQTVFAGNSAFAPINGESASGVGVDFAATARPADGLELGASASWNDLALDAPIFFNDASLGDVLIFDKGDRLSYSSEYTLGVSASYAFPLGGRGLEGRFATSYNVSSAQTARTFFPGAAAIVNTGDDIENVRASFAVGSGDRWEASLFVDNLTDEDDAPVRYDGWDMFFPNFIQFSSRVRPRTVGVQFEYRFAQ
jgi:outer membrane receptor protein involved in Fe transport